jgi:hypothetical protein
VTAARAALAVLSTGTALLAVWLALVVLTVLPARSPESIPAWVAIETLVIALVAIGVAWLVSPSVALAIATRVLGVVAVGVGGWLAAAWILTPPGEAGEGYLLLIGAWLVLHGVVALVSTSVPRRSLGAAR